MIQNNHAFKIYPVVSLLQILNQPTRSYFSSVVKMSEAKNHNETIAIVAEVGGNSDANNKGSVMKRHANTQHGDKDTADEENIVVS